MILAMLMHVCRCWPVALALLTAGCGSTPRSVADLPPELRETNIVSMHSGRVPEGGTYSWVPESQVQLDERFDAPETERQIRGLLEQGLARRGFQRVGEGSGDYAIGYVIAVGKSIDDSALDRRYHLARQGSTASSTSYERGALVVDIFDRRISRPVWRGAATLRADPTLPEAVRRERVQLGVGLLLERFNPTR